VKTYRSIATNHAVQSDYREILRQRFELFKPLRLGYLKTKETNVTTFEHWRGFLDALIDYRRHFGMLGFGGRAGGSAEILFQEGV
jgi:hypothetical protein